MAYEFHPLAGLFPLLEGKELEDLASDIATHGLADAITLYEGLILDGRNRYRACELAGIEPRYETYAGAEPLAFVISKNLHRRHLNESQRAMVAARAADMPQGTNRYTIDRPIGRSISQSEAADMLSVGERSVRRARKVLDEGTAELVAAVERGEIAVSQAARIAKMDASEQVAVVEEVRNGAKPKEAQKRAINRAREKEAETARSELSKRAPSAADRFALICGDIATTKLEGCADIIITDPPYGHEHLPLYEALGRRAAEWLPEGGSLFIMVGQSYLPEVLYALEQHMVYHWTLAYLTPGGQSAQLWARRVNTFWKPVLWFTNGEHNGAWIGDVAKSDPNDNDKRFHRWGQSESGMRNLMARVVRPGMTILDPFCGGGTTGVVALSLDCRFIGIDIDEDMITATRARLQEFTP